jgi:hypothetical protein
MYHVVRVGANMKTDQVHFRIDPAKHRALKENGGYGIIQMLGDIAVDDYLMTCPISGLSDEARIEIEEIRLKINRERTRKRIMAACMKEVAGGHMGVVAKFGLRRKLLQEITQAAREWWYEKFQVLPSDPEIHAAIKEYYVDNQPDLDVLRGEQVQRTMEDYVATHLEMKAAPATVMGRDIGGAREDCEV